MMVLSTVGEMAEAAMAVQLCSHLWAEVTSIHTSVALCGTLSYQGTACEILGV